jgi:DNA-directed RNA polymerase sigma subunit (sigma70/sigma32)
MAFAAPLDMPNQDFSTCETAYNCRAQLPGLAATLNRALSEYLSPREADIVRLGFGLDRHGEERTLGDVGQQLGLSRERVRQLEAEAFRKLRHAGRFRREFQEYESMRARAGMPCATGFW